MKEGGLRQYQTGLLKSQIWTHVLSNVSRSLNIALSFSYVSVQSLVSEGKFSDHRPTIPIACISTTHKLLLLKSQTSSHTTVFSFSVSCIIWFPSDHRHPKWKWVPQFIVLLQTICKVYEVPWPLSGLLTAGAHCMEEVGTNTTPLSPNNQPTTEVLDFSAAERLRARLDYTTSCIFWWSHILDIWNFILTP